MKYRDTVSSVGLLGKTLKYTQSGPSICLFRHALALDERRVKFLPEYVTPQLTVKEVWFAGNHSDVYDCRLSSAILIWMRLIHTDMCQSSGGGNHENMKVKLRNPSLIWMIHEATMAGLRFQMINFVDMHDENMRKGIRRTKSLKAWEIWWWFLEILPFLRWKTHKRPGTRALYVFELLSSSSRLRLL